ncbi:MAG TPA: dTMP kinase [Terriglobales bacterium]|nr:dTMP kinase [Terriglobales bacterium]
MRGGRGLFITFEGLDGCGKTTQLAHLKETLSSRGPLVLSTREPGGTAVGERIRSILLDSRTAGLSSRAELALMFADRAQHVEEVIEPALQSGKIVLCDRYTDSTEAYQGYGRQLGSELVLNLHRQLCHDLWPDLTLLLDSDLDASISRARNRNQNVRSSEGRFEAEDEVFFRRVHYGFEQIAQREAARVIRISTGSIQSTAEEIIKIVEQRFPQTARRAEPAVSKIGKRA